LILSIKLLGFLKILQVFSLSAIKLIVAPPLAYGLGFNYIQTILITTIGGICGVLFFYYISGWIISQYKYIQPYIIKLWNKIKNKKHYDNLIHLHLQKPKKTRKGKIFTRRNRLIVNTKNKYGLIGIALLTPIFFSIPLGAFIANRYFSHKKRTPSYLAIAVIFWSVIISSVLFIFSIH
jgi:hypothetical protein